MNHTGITTNRKKGAVLRSLLLCAAAVWLLLHGIAAVRAEEQETVWETFSDAGTGISSEQAAQGFIRRTMPSRTGTISIRKSNSSTTTQMGTRELALYHYLKEKIHAVATGELCDTAFAVPAYLIYEDVSYSAAELGLEALTGADGKILAAAKNAFYAKVPLDLAQVHTALLIDCPYDLYWYDKTVGVTAARPSLTVRNDRIQFANLETGTVQFNMYVSVDYSSSGGENTFETNPVFGRSLQVAAVMAGRIVEENAEKDDIAKLTAYKDTICELVAYNSAAAGASSMPYGNPWQLVWVLDGNPDTKVVCEGYSKAFQYLCDLSGFQGSVSCVSVYGDMQSSGGSPGAHMWNIVTIDGNRCLADITNCDAGNSGYPDLLFLKGYTRRGQTAQGEYVYYYAVRNGKTLQYVYDPDMAAMFPEDELALSGDIPGADDGTYTSGTCGDASWRMNGDGVLSITGSGKVTASGSGLWDKTKLTAVYLGNGITGIGADTFTDCPNLTEIHFPQSGLANGVDDGAFTPRDTEAETDPRTFYIASCTMTNLIAWCSSRHYTFQTAAHADLACMPDQAPTCTEDGWDNRITCSGCGFEYRRGIPKTGHRAVTDDARAATCTETGLTEGSHCSRCGTVITAQEVVPARGHDWNTAYEWAGDHSAVTAKHTCKNDESHTETETADVTAVILSPTDETAGSVTYTSAEFATEGFTAQTETVEIPALKDMSAVYLPGMLAVIEDEAFENLAWEAVILPDGCVSVGSRAFRGCGNLRYVRVPAGTGTAPDAFEGCDHAVIDRAAE